MTVETHGVRQVFALKIRLREQNAKCLPVELGASLRDGLARGRFGRLPFQLGAKSAEVRLCGDVSAQAIAIGRHPHQERDDALQSEHSFPRKIS